MDMRLITWQYCSIIAVFGATVVARVAISSDSPDQLRGPYESSDATDKPDIQEALGIARDAISAIDYERYWPQWRGPLGTGFAPHAHPPVEWSETNNLRWKVPVPGKGHSTPAIWDDRIFITTAVADGDSFEPRYSGAPGGHDEVPISQSYRFIVIAFNRADGKVL